MDEAILLYERAAKTRPAWAEGWWYLGTIHYGADRYSECTAAFEKLVALKPKGGAGWAMLGLCEFQLAKYEKSLASLQRGRALGLGQSVQLTAATRFHAAILMNRFGQHEHALQLLYALVRQESETASLVQALGLAALRIPRLPSELPAERTEMIDLAGRAHLEAGGRVAAEAGKLFQELVRRYPG